MADFSPPFGSDGGANRSPTTDEQAGGFECGAADKDLFNRLFGRVEAELKAIQDAGGIAGSENDDTTVLQAIQALIASATGGGSTDGYILFSQAQARMPIFPEVQTDGGVIGITSPSAGAIQVPAGSQILHRGIGLYTTSQQNIATLASKTYHLRWNKDDGFALKDLSDTFGYNQAALAEDHVNFDSGYDDMLVARIVTNSSNVASIVHLVNKSILTVNEILSQTAYNSDGLGSAWFEFYKSINWARTPATYSFTPAKANMSDGASDNDFNIRPAGAGLAELNASGPQFDINRYRLSQTVLRDWTSTLNMHFSARA